VTLAWFNCNGWWGGFRVSWESIREGNHGDNSLRVNSPSSPFVMDNPSHQPMMVMMSSRRQAMVGGEVRGGRLIRV
jgi:hypothetical protein